MRNFIIIKSEIFILLVRYVQKLVTVYCSIDKMREIRKIEESLSGQHVLKMG